MATLEDEPSLGKDPKTDSREARLEAVEKDVATLQGKNTT